MDMRFSQIGLKELIVKRMSNDGLSSIQLVLNYLGAPNMVSKRL